VFDDVIFYFSMRQNAPTDVSMSKNYGLIRRTLVWERGRVWPLVSDLPPAGGRAHRLVTGLQRLEWCCADVVPGVSLCLHQQQATEVLCITVVHPAVR